MAFVHCFIIYLQYVFICFICKTDFSILWIRMLRLSKVNHLKIKSLIRIGMRSELWSFDATSELLAALANNIKC